jgi:hypothetical protein
MVASANPAPGHSIASVQFMVDGTVVGASTSNPPQFSYVINNLGTYQLSASATDDVGNVGTSNPITLNVVGFPLTVLVGSSLQGSTTDIPGNAAGQLEGFQYVGQDDGAATFMVVYLDSTTTAETTVAAVYSDINLLPGNLVASVSFPSVPGNWNVATLPTQVSVVGGLYYWLALLSPYNGGLVVYRRNDDNYLNNDAEASYTTLTAFPAQWGTAQAFGACCTTVSMYIGAP